MGRLKDNMRAAGCDKSGITEFAKYFADPNPQSLYALNIQEDLEENKYSQDCVQRLNERMSEFWRVVERRCHAKPGKVEHISRLSLDLNSAICPPEIGQLSDLQTLDLHNNKLTDLPQEFGQLSKLQTLLLHNNKLTDLPREFGQLKALQTLRLHHNEFTALPPEIGQLKALQALYLYHNQLTALPPEIGQLSALQTLSLYHNQLTALPPEIGQLSALQTLNLNENQLTDLPDTIGNLRNLARLDLRNNRFTHVPRALLDLPANTEVLFEGNPLPDEEINAVRQEITQRRAQGFEVPDLILLGENELRDAAEVGMNVHHQVLTDAVKRRIDDLASQFKGHLRGTFKEQRAEMLKIERRLTETLDQYTAENPENPLCAAAQQTAQRMFATGLGRETEYFNDFQYSSGHVLSYVFLALEKQWSNTPQQHFDEARENGLQQLIARLASGQGHCDTRHTEEVSQLVGMPLSTYAAAHPEIVPAVTLLLTKDKVRETTLPVAKKMLKEVAQEQPALLDDNEALQVAFSTALSEVMLREHPAITAQQLTAYLKNEILPAWETFKDVVNNPPKQRDH